MTHPVPRNIWLRRIVSSEIAISIMTHDFQWITTYILLQFSQKVTIWIFTFFVYRFAWLLKLVTSCLMAEFYSFIVVVTTERLYIVQFFRFRFILHIASSALPHIQLWIEHQKLYLPWDGLRQHAIPSYHQLPDLTNRACLVPPQARWAEHTRSWSSTT